MHGPYAVFGIYAWPCCLRSSEITLRVGFCSTVAYFQLPSLLCSNSATEVYLKWVDIDGCTQNSSFIHHVCRLLVFSAGFVNLFFFLLSLGLLFYLFCSFPSKCLMGLHEKVTPLSNQLQFEITVRGRWAGLCHMTKPRDVSEVISTCLGRGTHCFCAWSHRGESESSDLVGLFSKQAVPWRSARRPKGSWSWLWGNCTAPARSVGGSDSTAASSWLWWWSPRGTFTTRHRRRRKADNNSSAPRRSPAEPLVFACPAAARRSRRILVLVDRHSTRGRDGAKRPRSRISCHARKRNLSMEITLNSCSSAPFWTMWSAVVTWQHPRPPSTYTRP